MDQEKNKTEVVGETNMATPTSEEQTKENNNKIIDDLISKIQKNDFTVYLFTPPMNMPSGGISVLFKQAQLLRSLGMKTKIIYEPREDSKASYEASLKTKKKTSVYEPFNPTWLGNLLDGIELLPLGDGTLQFTDKTKVEASPLTVNAEDFLIIPEGWPNIMEKTAQMPCKRIVLCQSWYYVLNSIPVGQKWQHFGIADVISVSDGITQYLNAVMPGLHIKNYSQSIDRNIFKSIPNTRKVPKIAYTPGRSQESLLKTINVIKTFYAFYPQYRWVRFDELKGLSKEDFAERLGESSIFLYTDDIAGFGTSPLEAMAMGTHVVGWTPLGGKEYMKENNGFWATNGDIFQLAELLGFAVEKLINGELDAPDITREYENTLDRYTEEKEKESIKQIFNQYKDERINQLISIKQ
jgi:hypothetical protein